MRKWETPKVTVLSTKETEHNLSGLGLDNNFSTHQQQDNINNLAGTTIGGS